jgi:hyaluronoglucosaminidase
VDRIFGIVEGFYRRPYTFDQRLDLIDFLSALGLNTYIYGPKADPYHRKHWRKPYTQKKLMEFEKLNEISKKKNIKFVYALSPVYRPELSDVLEKIAAMKAIGIAHFSIFFDDIRVRLDTDSAERQLRLVNGLYEHLGSEFSNPSLSFCPTQYHGFKETPYIESIAAHLHPEIDIFWTGKKVVSPEITEDDVDRITQLLNRRVLIWDNIFANDYIPGKILRFPYRNRTPTIINKIKGILINPMNNYLQSKPLIYTAAEYFKDPENYDPVKAWQNATINHKCGSPHSP